MSFGDRSKKVLGKFLKQLLLDIGGAKVKVMAHYSSWGRSNDFTFVKFYITPKSGVEVLLSASNHLYFEGKYYWHKYHLEIIAEDSILIDRVFDPPLLWQKGLDRNQDNPEYLVAQIFEECHRQDKEIPFDRFGDVYDSDLNKRIRRIVEREDTKLSNQLRQTLEISQA